MQWTNVYCQKSETVQSYIVMKPPALMLTNIQDTFAFNQKEFLQACIRITTGMHELTINDFITTCFHTWRLSSLCLVHWNANEHVLLKQLFCSNFQWQRMQFRCQKSCTVLNSSHSSTPSSGGGALSLPKPLDMFYTTF